MACNMHARVEFTGFNSCSFSFPLCSAALLSINRFMVAIALNLLLRKSCVISHMIHSVSQNDVDDQDD